MRQMIINLIDDFHKANINHCCFPNNNNNKKIEAGEEDENDDYEEYE